MEETSSSRAPGHIETVDFRVEQPFAARGGAYAPWWRLIVAMLLVSVLGVAVMVVVQAQQLATQADELARTQGSLRSMSSDLTNADASLRIVKANLRVVCGQAEVQQLASRSADLLFEIQSVVPDQFFFVLPS